MTDATIRPAFTQKQREARNEAYQLIAIASRILKDAGLTAYAEDAERLRNGMKIDNAMLHEQEMRRRLGQ